MTKRSGGDTVNSGPAPRPDRPDPEADPIVGNARGKGEDPSPDDRDRGETSLADPPPVDAGVAHDRAC
jgi:hypothetical protein